MQLPIMASPNEAFLLVKYLSTKVSGSTIEDASAAVGKKVMDARKVNAYVVWGLIERDSDKVRLTSRGKDLCKAPNDEIKQHVYQRVIRDVPEYYGVMEWLMYMEPKQDSVTNVEVAEYWHDASKYGMSNENDNTLKDRAVCLFRVCEAAGIGKLYIGRKGLATRLVINHDELSNVVSGENSVQEKITCDNMVVNPKTSSNENLENKSSIDNGMDENNISQSDTSFVELPIPFIDGRLAVLRMPKNADKNDAKYVFDMLQLMMTRQYSLDDN